MSTEGIYIAWLLRQEFGQLGKCLRNSVTLIEVIFHSLLCTYYVYTIENERENSE